MHFHENGNQICRKSIHFNAVHVPTFMSIQGAKEINLMLLEVV